MMSRIRLIFILTFCTASLLAGCANNRAPSYANNKPLLSAREYLQMSKTAQGPEKQRLLLNASRRLAEDHQPTQAQQILNRLSPTELGSSLLIEKQLIQASVQLQNHRASQAIDTLRNIEQLPALSPYETRELKTTLAMAYRQQGNIIASIEQRDALTTLLPDAKARAQNNTLIWQELQTLNTQALIGLSSLSLPDSLKGWITLALYTKEYADQPSTLISHLANWREQYPNHPGNQLLPAKLRSTQALNITSPKHIALLLPLEGPLAESAKAIRNGFTAAYYQSKQKNANAPIITVLDTSQGNISQIYALALQKGADMVVGPLTKQKIAQLVEHTRLSVPTLALNTLPDAQSSKNINNLYQFGLSPLDEAKQVADKAWNDHHSRALIITSANEWGQRVGDTFKQTWQQLGGKIIGQMNYTSQKNLASDISKLLNVYHAYQQEKTLKNILREKIRFIPRRREDIDAIFLVANPLIARQIRPLLNYYFAGNVPIYAISQIYSGTPNAHGDRDLNGIIFCDMPWVLNPHQLARRSLAAIQQQAKSTWPRNYQTYPKLYALGIDAYNIAMQLNTLQLLPQIGTKAATGTLYLTSQNQIYRQLSWSQIRNGLPSSL